MMHTKFSMPKISKSIIKRNDIEKKLMLLPECQLALVTAPAGYGKTTAIADFITGQSLKHAWFSLDETDNDPVRFWRYLATSVSLSLKNYSFAKISINKELLLSNITIHVFIDLLNEISENLILVLDNFQFIDNDLIKETLIFFIQCMPPHVQVIVISRKEADSKFLLQLSSSVRIGIKDLIFNVQEIKELFIKRGIYLNETEIRRLQQYTEGWAAGLVMSSCTIKEYIENKNSCVISCENKSVDDYFLHEVFDSWSEEVKEFLVATSFLSTLSGPLCHRVTGNDKSEELLNALSDCNSFIIPVSHESKSYVHHHLFKEFLLCRLQKMNPQTQRLLYHNAGEWFLENNLVEDAIHCFIKAKAYGKAFELISDRNTYMAINEYSTYQKLIESIPEELCESNTMICTDYSWMLSTGNQLEKAEAWANKAQECFNRCHATLDKKDRNMLEARIAANYFNIAIVNMDIDSAEHYYKKITGLDINSPIVIGEMNTGEISLLKTVHGFKGNLRKIDAIYGKYLDSFPTVFGDYSSYFAVILAECQYERNDLHSVYTTLSKFMGRITSLKNPGVITPCFILLAKVKIAKGDEDEAFTLIESGRKFLNTNCKNIWTYYFNVFAASLYIRKGDAENAAKYLDMDQLDVFDALSGSREFEYIVFARYLMLINRLDESLLLLSRLEEFADKEKRLKSHIEILCLKAINHNLRGEPSEAMSILDTAIGLSMEAGYVRTFIDEGKFMAELLIKYRAWGKSRGNKVHLAYARMLGIHSNQFHDFTALPSASTASVALDFDTYPVGAHLSTSHLSTRELEVLKLLVAEYSNIEIADELFITERTVKHHNARIYEKLGVKNRLEAIMKAREISLFQ